MKNALAFMFVAACAALGPAAPAQAKLRVVATVPDLKALVAEVGGDAVTVDSIARGTQDPHSIEAKPSFMTQVSRADLVVAVGLELEQGWLPSLLRGARNPKITPGNPGYLEIAPALDPLEVATGKVSRAEGDVHPLGNPHVTLDPIRMGKAATLIGDRLAQLDASHAGQFKDRAKSLQARLVAKTAEWKKRIDKSGVKKAVSYHRTLTYFFDRFGIDNPAILEPKPGIPPTSGHVLEVIQLIQAQKVPLILVENYFDPTVTKRIQEAVPGLQVATVPVSVEGASGVATLDDLYEKLVQAVESAGRKP